MFHWVPSSIESVSITVALKCGENVNGVEKGEKEVLRKVEKSEFGNVTGKIFRIAKNQFRKNI